MTDTAGLMKGQVATPARFSPYRVQVLDRSLRILEALADVDESLGPADLARHLSLHKTTIHRLLMVLAQHGLLRRDPRLGKYSLGVKLFELGSSAVARFNLRDCAEQRLVNETRETAHVCIVDGHEMVSIANVEGPWTMRTPSTDRPAPSGDCARGHHGRTGAIEYARPFRPEGT
jgi:DNA-binding IclR family transcriptional regulator